MEHMALHLNLGLVTKGIFALPKASPGEAKQYLNEKLANDTEPP